MAFSYKKMDVYILALDFVEKAAGIVNQIPRGYGYLGDQLKRSASSSVLNIGEGAGEFAKKEKVRFYRMALRSATESASTIDIIHRFLFIDDKLHEEIDQILDRIVSMLTKLIQRHEEDAFSRSGSGESPGREREPRC